MPDAVREALFLERLLVAVPEVSHARILRGEAPDYILQTKTRRIGVELTEFHLAPDSGQKPFAETSALRWRVVETAQELHAALGGPPLYVHCMFHDAPTFTKRDIGALAQQISNAVLLTSVPSDFTAGPSRVCSKLLPRAVARIWFWPSVDGEDLLWQPSEAGWVAQIPEEQISAVIAKKDKKTTVYRTACTEVWLVIVHYAGIGAPAELSEAAASARYPSTFDRVIWLNPLTPKVLDLGTGIT